jgi:ATP-binding cassette subfamily B (MDR/TAP) protein 1
MAQPTGSTSSDEKDKVKAPQSEEQEGGMQMGWKALFRFMTKKHVPLFASAMISTGIAGATMPVFAILYGRIFRDYTDYGLGKIDSEALRSSVARYCLILTGIASLSLIAKSFHLFFFLIFGEVQARSARNMIFDALIRKDMAWYDTRDTGIAAFLPAIQMLV